MSRNKRKFDIKRFFKYHLIRLMRIKDSYQRIARGFAWGAFLAIWPSMPFNTILALTCAPLFGGNSIAAVIGSWVVGPFVVAPIYYYASYLTGKFLFNILALPVQEISFHQMNHFLYIFFRHPWKSTLYYLSPDGISYFWSKVSGFFLAMEIGGVILGLIGAVIAYYSVSYIEKWFINHKKVFLTRLKEKIKKSRKLKEHKKKKN